MGLTSNLCAAQGESPIPGMGKKSQHTHKGSGVWRYCSGEHGKVLNFVF